MTRFHRILAACAATLLLALPAFAQDKVVYHIDNSQAQATKGLRNVRDHLSHTARRTVPDSGSCSCFAQPTALNAYNTYFLMEQERP